MALIAMNPLIFHVKIVDYAEIIWGEMDSASPDVN